jgi:predicted HTH transcriptional regulator
VGCYKIKKLLPKRFHNVDLKTNEEYKKWKKAEDKKFNDKIVKFDDKCWWDSLDKNKRKEYVDKYGSKEITYQRRHRFTQSLGYCKKYKIIDETFFK